MASYMLVSLVQRIRNIHWFVIGNLILYAIYAIIYGRLDAKNFNGIDGPMSRSTIAYFTAVSQSSTGYGDISPKSDLARRIVTSHVFLTWALLTTLSITS
jgi:hypothetical protein